jgi:hypothetical protein
VKFRSKIGAENSGAQILRVYPVDVLNVSDNPGDRCALMLMDLDCALFPGSPPRGTLVPIVICSWFTLTSVSIPRDGEIRIQFQKTSIHFKSANGKEISELIATHVWRFLTPHELELIALPSGSGAREAGNSASFLFRLTYLLDSARVHQRRKIVVQVANALRIASERLQQLSLGRDSAKTVRILLECLGLRNPFRHLGFEQTGQILFDSIVDEWNSLNQIEHFIFSEPPTRRFIEKVNSAANGNLSGITFCNCSLEGEFIQMIVDLLGGGVIASLGFRAGLRPDSISMITSIRDFNNIRFLEIDNIQDLILDKLFPSLRHLEVLALTNCNISIGAVFALIQDIGFPELEMLNLSGNVGDRFDPKTILPENLAKLHINNVVWEIASFADVIKAAVEHAPESGDRMKLSLAHVTFSNGRWAALAPLLAELHAEHLELLAWDGNPLSDQFFRFLANAPNRTTVSLAECLTVDNFQLVLDFFRGTPTIENLILRGSFATYQSFFTPGHRPPVRILEDLPELFKVLRQTGVVKKLDVRYQLLDESACDTLAQWAKKSPLLEFLSFDGTRVSTVDAFLRFCDVCHFRDAPISVAFLEHDLKRIASAASRSLIEEVQRLKHMLRSIRKPKAHRKPFTGENRMFAPIDAFSGTIDDTFPEYLAGRRIAKPTTATFTRRTGAPDTSSGMIARSTGGATASVGGRALTSSFQTHSTRPSTTTGGNRKTEPTQPVPRQSARMAPRREAQEPVWRFPIAPVPEIDNTRIIEKLGAQYSIERLLTVVRKTG